MLLSAWKMWRPIVTARASSHWLPEKLQCSQEEQLRRLLRHAYDHVPLYRRLYNEAGFRPEMFCSLDDLKRVPTLPKRLLKEGPPEDLVARGVDPGRCQVVKTSGSTGTPLQIYLGPSEERWQRAVAWRILFEHGFRWTDHTLEIRMTLGPRFLVQKLGIAPKDWISILEPPQCWARHLAHYKHEVILACASTLQALAEAVETLGLEVRPPRIIISDGETLTPATRGLVHRVLGTEPVDVFGLVEVSNFAWQCEQREGFHISADSHIVEVAASPGEVGQVIVTGLGMRTMPIIRYETGDMAEVAPEACRCGRTLPMLARLYGRVTDAVLMPNGQQLYWPYFHEILGGYSELHQWQVVQDHPYQVRVKLAMRQGMEGLLERIRSDLRRAFPAEFDLVLETVDKIPAKPGEKRREIVSRLQTGQLQP